MSDYAAKERERAAAHAEYTRRTDALNLIIRPLRTAQYEVDHDWRYMQKALEEYGQDYGQMELNPDFQRGHVWTEDQQRHFIENVLRGVVSTSGFLVQFNCPNFEMADHDYAGGLPLGMQCVDGLQRITAVQKFIDGEIRPFGLSVDDLNCSAFSTRGSRHRFRVAIHNFQSRADLLQHYLDLNAGGTPHTAAEIERVRKLRDAALAGEAKPAQGRLQPARPAATECDGASTVDLCADVGVTIQAFSGDGKIENLPITFEPCLSGDMGVIGYTLDEAEERGRAMLAAVAHVRAIYAAQKAAE